MDILKDKASMAELNQLHNIVATILGSELKRQHDIVEDEDEHKMTEFLPDGIDTKLLAQAITFLKNNNISADILESDSMISLTDSIKKIANNNSDDKATLTVEDMLAIHD